MNDCKLVDTPMVTGLSLSTLEFTDNKVKSFPYHLVIGMLSYIAQCMRPNILFAVIFLSQYSNAFDSTHVQALKHMFHYLQWSQNIAICYDKAKVKSGDGPIGYSNADWGNAIPGRKSVSGCVFTFSSGPICWSSHTQTLHSTIFNGIRADSVI